MPMRTDLAREAGEVPEGGEWQDLEEEVSTEENEEEDGPGPPL